MIQRAGLENEFISHGRFFEVIRGFDESELGSIWLSQRWHIPSRWKEHIGPVVFNIWATSSTFMF